jgi:hypothetical protein
MSRPPQSSSAKSESAPPPSSKSPETTESSSTRPTDSTSKPSSNTPAPDELIKILAAEVKAWRAWYEEEMDINVTEPLFYQAVINARAATDAAKAM